MMESFSFERIDNSSYRDSFWKRVNFEPGQGPNGDCHQWIGAKMTGTGYGQVAINGKKRGAHRIAWALTAGRAPTPDEHICHKCDNPICVRPDHLWVGTRRDNMRDMIIKNRWRGPARLHSEQTHCKRGHEFTPDNIYWKKNGGKNCKTCNRARAAQFYEQKRHA